MNGTAIVKQWHKIPNYSAGRKKLVITSFNAIIKDDEFHYTNELSWQSEVRMLRSVCKRDSARMCMHFDDYTCQCKLDRSPCGMAVNAETLLCLDFTNIQTCVGSATL